MSTASDLPSRLDWLQGRALIVGAAGLGVTLIIALIVPHRALPSYLVAFLFWVGLSLGCVAITLLHHLVGGSWGLLVRRPLESGALTIVPMAVLFLPLLLGLGVLYPWARSEEVAQDLVLQHKASYLNRGGFMLRAAIDFAFWITLAVVLNRGSVAQDRTEDPTPSRRLQRLSGPGLALVFFTATFAVIDWAMSLEPKWYSTIYSPMVIVGWGLETFATMIIAASLLSRFEPMHHEAEPGRLQDLGNLMLAFVMLWAYMSFSQFLIIWSGNLVEEVPWYLRRTRGGWEWVVLALVLFHFFAPFFVLLFRDVKRHPGRLMWVAVAVVVAHLLDLTWLVIPARAADPLRPVGFAAEVFLVPIAAAGVGGIWVAAFARALKGKPLIPLHDPDINPAVEHAPGG